MTRLGIALGAAAVILVATGAAVAGQPQEVASPSYAIPNLVAVVMAATLLAIPFKRLRRS
jgi:hypothetical protein